MRKKVVIDIGHLLADSGAVANGFREVDLNEEIGDYAVSALRRSGIDVLITSGSLANRCEKEKSFKPNCFVSIHNNAGMGDGVEVLYMSPNGKVLAQAILDSVVGNNLNNSRGLKHRPDLYVLRNTNSPAALIECAFLDSADVHAVDEAHERKAFGETIAKGICNYLGVAFITEASAPTNSNLVKITASILNVRKGPGVNHQVTTTVKQNDVYTIVEKANGWGKLKSGAGWISLNYTTSM